MKVLILGGYGVFGGRLAELISDIREVEMLIAGRNRGKAEAFCASLDGPAQARPLAMDRAGIAQTLADEAPDLVVDASGPFQDYGDDPYDVVRACIRARVNYLDFADGADFVFGISQFENEAKAAGIYVLSGVSSFPVLTAAVLRKMAQTMEITSVTGGIAPSPYAGIGLNVMRAVVGYAGAPVKIWRGGQPTEAIGLAESMRFTIAVPGRLPLRNIHFSLVDVPDIQILPPEHAGLQDIWMGAGPVPEALHRALNFLAKMRATLRLPSLAPLSRLFYIVLNLMKFGEHRGGMFVRACGVQNGKATEQCWHLLAEGDDGPYIPSMAVEAIIRKVLLGTPPAPGARAATRALELEDYEQLFEHRTIYAGMRWPVAESAPLYERLLGPAFAKLPGQVRALHTLTQPRVWAGQAQVRRGKNWAARLVAGAFGFPPATEATPVTVTLDPQQGGELWTRDFGGKTFSSFQAQGTGRNEHLLVERFGMIKVALALVLKDERLYLIPRSWTCLGVPMPRLMLPRGETYESDVNGAFRFNVEIRAPLVGLFVAYKGELTPSD